MAEAQYEPRLKTLYRDTIRGKMNEKFNYPNPMMMPSLDKIVINMGVGEASQDRKKMDGAVADLTAITGQKPIVTRAKKSIAGFKLRALLLEPWAEGELRRLLALPVLRPHRGQGLLSHRLVCRRRHPGQTSGDRGEAGCWKRRESVATLAQSLVA